MYGTIPIAASLANKGMREDYIASFCMASILLNPQLIIYSMALGNVLAAIRIISCALCGVVAGLLIYLFYHKKNKKFFDFSKFEITIHNKDVDKNLIIRYLKNVLRNIKATGIYFLLGIIYNENLHWRENRDYETPLRTKLSNLVIKRMITEIFS